MTYNLKSRICRYMLFKFTQRTVGNIDMFMTAHANNAVRMAPGLEGKPVTAQIGKKTLCDKTFFRKKLQYAVNSGKIGSSPAFQQNAVNFFRRQYSFSLRQDGKYGISRLCAFQMTAVQ